MKTETTPETTSPFTALQTQSARAVQLALRLPDEVVADRATFSLDLSERGADISFFPSQSLPDPKTKASALMETLRQIGLSPHHTTHNREEMVFIQHDPQDVAARLWDKVIAEALRKKLDDASPEMVSAQSVDVHSRDGAVSLLLKPNRQFDYRKVGDAVQDVMRRTGLPTPRFEPTPQGLRLNIRASQEEVYERFSGSTMTQALKDVGQAGNRASGTGR